MLKNNKKSLWPLFIALFISFGIFMAYWTVTQAISLPVQESNDYMLKYQIADININDILKKKKNFDKKYIIKIKNVEMMVMTDNIHSNIPQANPVKLSKGSNHFAFEVLNTHHKLVDNAKVDFLLTRPFSVKEDKLIKNIKNENGIYIINEINITKAGRYTLDLRVEISPNCIGYLKVPAYLSK